MANQITNHKCPACTGPLHYVGSTGKLQCDYCGSSYTAEEIEAFYQKAEEAAAEAFEEPKEEQWDGMRTYSCPSCGAELLCDETTAATSCPYCGNPTVIPGQFQGAKRPEFIIPFQIDKKKAEESLKEHYKGKRLLPKDFVSNNNIEKIQGVYVPFWLCDMHADADVSFEGTRSHCYMDGDYEVTETDHYRVRRAGRVTFQKIPVDASKKMADNYMDAIEPYLYGELKEFSTAYLPGYLADKFDQSPEDVQLRVDERCKDSAVDVMRNRAKPSYDSLVEKDCSCNTQLEKAHYVLLPVWLLTTHYAGEKYLFAMNGQTGKIVSNLPIDQKKLWLWTLGLTLGIGFVLFLLWVIIQYFIPYI